MHQLESDAYINRNSSWEVSLLLIIEWSDNVAFYYGNVLISGHHDGQVWIWEYSYACNVPESIVVLECIFQRYRILLSCSYIASYQLPVNALNKALSYNLYETYCGTYISFNHIVQIHLYNLCFFSLKDS